MSLVICPTRDRRAITEQPFELIEHFRADFVGIFTDAWADGGHQVRRRCVETLKHLLNSAMQNSRYHTAPSRMNRSHFPAIVAGQQDWNAIGDSYADHSLRIATD